MRFFEKHNYESVEFLGNFFYKFELLNEKNSFHYDKIVSTVFIIIVNKAMLNANTVLYAIKFNKQNTNLTNIQ